jgi:hypothetical protein
MIVAFRQMLIDLLDDADGVNETGFLSMQAAAATIFSQCPDCCDDIFAATQATEGRHYLPEDHGLQANNRGS